MVIQPRHLIALAIPVALMVPTQASAKNEVMTDRCSGEVAIVPSYGDKPDAANTVLLNREPDGQDQWTYPINVKLSENGYIRWWCHSTQGNWLDPGTWRWRDGAVVGLGCDYGGQYPGESSISGCKPKASQFPITTSDYEGWTAERSRCGNRSTKIRARVGPDRLLKIECLGR
jgi:hypothetical protein